MSWSRTVRAAVRSVVVASSVTMLAAAATSRGVAAQTPNREAALEIRTRFLADLDTLQKKFLMLAQAFPAEKYSWRPAEGVRSVGEAFMHVASEYYVFTPMAYGATASPVVGRGREAFQKFEADSGRESVMKHLNESFAYMKQALNGLDAAAITGPQNLFGGQRTIVETTLIMSGDLHEHLGQLIAYARMNGIKPPWSQ